MIWLGTVVFISLPDLDPDQPLAGVQGMGFRSYWGYWAGRALPDSPLLSTKGQGRERFSPFQWHLESYIVYKLPVLFLKSRTWIPSFFLL